METVLDLAGHHLIYFQLKNTKVVKTQELVKDTIMVDFDATGHIVGLEILSNNMEIRINDDNRTIQLPVVSKKKIFNDYAKQWKHDARLLSIRGIVEHESYRNIIKMGWEAVPFIINDLEENGPHHWFWALETITKINPVPEDLEGDITMMTACWIEWAKEKKII